jgi:hypothetical protein
MKVVLDRNQQLVSGFVPIRLLSEVPYHLRGAGCCVGGRCGQLVNNSALSGVVGVSSTTIGSWLSILEASDLVPHRVFDMDIVNHNGGNHEKVLPKRAPS